MKLNKLANLYLEYMVKEFSKTNKTTFTDWNMFLSLQPNETEDHIHNAFSKLKNDGLVNIFYADNIPYSVTLLTDAILEVEENTKLKQVYEFLKEVKDWI